MAQVGAFSSTTTVTGLPSTPSRKPTRHPHARRACVNPFSMGRSYRASPWIGRANGAGLDMTLFLGPLRGRAVCWVHLVRLLEESLYFALELGFGGDSRVFLRNVAVAPDDHRHRDAEERAERFLHVLAPVADEQAVV